MTWTNTTTLFNKQCQKVLLSVKSDCFRGHMPHPVTNISVTKII